MRGWFCFKLAKETREKKTNPLHWAWWKRWKRWRQEEKKSFSSKLFENINDDSHNLLAIFCILFQRSKRGQRNQTSTSNWERRPQGIPTNDKVSVSVFALFIHLFWNPNYWLNICAQEPYSAKIYNLISDWFHFSFRFWYNFFLFLCLWKISIAIKKVIFWAVSFFSFLHLSQFTS